jgi:C-terminal binding-module, SLH-like, of glucodextranase
MTRRSLAAVAACALAAAPAAAAASQSLYSGPGSRPGPALLYSKAYTAKQLTNARPWTARPILVSGTRAYRKGEFLYQDFLYDDTGARQTADPNDPRTAGNLFSKPNGTYTYPTDPRYANNAADLVELRVKPRAHATAFRLTLNTMKDPKLVAFSIAIGASKAHYAFPRGANVRAPARLFLTVHPTGSGFAAELVRAKTGKRVIGPPITVRVDRVRRQIQVNVPHRDWNPGRRTVRLAAGVGLWDAAAKRYLLPQASADDTRPGGSGAATDPAAFFNVAFRAHEPVQKPNEGLAVVTTAAWWRDRDQGTALASNDISRFSTRVDFRKLRKRVGDESGVPKRGPMDRILPSHFETAQGADFSQACVADAATCPGQYRGRLQPYAIYIPRKPRPAAGYGMTLLLHSLSAQYNQYLGTRNQSQLGDRGGGSIVITPEARGPDESYENYGAADVFDVWADVARRYRLDPSWTAISGYSMGGIGTFKLGSQFPDLFARAQPTVGDESSTDVLASLRNVPVLMWNNHGDELVNDGLYTATAAKLDSLGYRYELDAYQPCSNSGCSPLFANHLQLAINDQYAPAAAFLGAARVNRNPAHVTYVVDEERNHANLGVVGDHAYWLSKLRLRDASSGQMDAISRGFGVGDPVASPTQPGAGTLTGGRFGTLAFNSLKRTWGPVVRRPRANQLDIDATGIASATVDVARARLSCGAKVKITSDGPLAVTLRGCNRTVHGG